MRAWFLGGLFLLACGGKGTPATATPQFATAEQQIARGGELYGVKCAKCHGASGEGTDKGPPVVGQGVLPLDPRPGAKRTVQFKTAMDVFQWAKKTMPADDPGSVSDADLLAIMAFDLSANGVKLSAPLDGPTAETIQLH
jgi:mono/diheme cytochrome c family protein